MLSGNADSDSVEAAARYKAKSLVKKPYAPQRIADNLNTRIMTLGPKS